MMQTTNAGFACKEAHINGSLKKEKDKKNLYALNYTYESETPIS